MLILLFNESVWIQVNKCVGVLGLNALHIAARCNNVVAMEMLLDVGGDVELQDYNNNTVLTWTTSYKVCMLLLLNTAAVMVTQIRCMILNSMLLCCAAFEGDVSMVTQLLNTTLASPNALGLK